MANDYANVNENANANANVGNVQVVQRPPLETPEILQRILQYCDASTLKNVRLVHKTWMEASASHAIALEFPIILVQQITRDFVETKLSTSLFKYLQIIQNSRAWREAKHLVLQKWIIDYHHLVLSPMDQFADMNINFRFWDLYTTNITILALKGCTIPSSANDHHLLPPVLMRAVPNLEKLSLVDCQYGDIIPEETDQEEVEEVHEKLVSLRIENLRDSKGKLVEIQDTRKLFKMNFTKLHRLCIRHQFTVESHGTFLEDFGSSFRSLTHLEIMENREFAYTRPINYEMASGKTWWKRLEKLSIDIGMYSEEGYVQKLLKNQSGSLRELHLYRAPNFQPWVSFDTTANFPNLTELHLWGTVADNLSFLGLMPQLKIFTWMASCYEDVEHGARLHHHLKNDDTLFSCLSGGSLVLKTEALENDCILANLTTLETDWGPITVGCWRKLGRWFPNLRKLKGTVSGNEEFFEIGKVWPDIEHLALAHESRVLADVVLEAFTKRGLFSKIRTFTWKSCVCYQRREINQEEEEKWKPVRVFLEGHIPGEITLPWDNAALGRPTRYCPQELFSKILSFSGILTTGFESAKAQFFPVFGTKRIPRWDFSVDEIQALMDNI